MTQTEIKTILNELDAYCSEKGVRNTPPRRMTLEVIANSTQPIGAYDIIEEMAKITDRPKPTTVYRAIDFLQQSGFIHKIESLNAFVICHAGHAHEGSQFIVCDNCGTVEEVHLCHIPGELQQKIQQSGFQLAHWNTEIHGMCQSCQ